MGQHLQLLLDLGVLGFQAVVLPLVLLQGQPHAARHLDAPAGGAFKPLFIFLNFFVENPPTINPQLSEQSSAAGVSRFQGGWMRAGCATLLPCTDSPYCPHIHGEPNKAPRTCPTCPQSFT